MRIASFLFSVVVCLLMFLPLIYADEYLRLDDIDTYLYTGEKYQKTCTASGICEMILSITHIANASENKISLDAFIFEDGKWTWADFNEYISMLDIQVHTDMTAKNTSKISSWESISPEYISAYIAEQPIGSAVKIRYLFHITEKVDIIPTYYISPGEYRSYTEYAIYIPSDHNGRQILYFPFDDNVTLPFTNKADNASPSYVYDFAGTMNHRNDGLAINGSADYMRMRSNTTSFYQDDAFVAFTPSTYFANDSITFSMLMRNMNTATGLGVAIPLRFSNGNDVFYTNFYTNGSIGLYLRDGDASPELEIFFPPFDFSKNVWNMVTLVGFDIGADVRFEFRINGSVHGTAQTVTGIGGLWTSFPNCAAPAVCVFGANSKSGSAALNGDYDEIRMYSTALSLAETQELYAAYTTSHNISFRDNISYVHTTQFTNVTLSINFSNTTFASFDVNDSLAKITNIGNDSLDLLLNSSLVGARVIKLIMNTTLLTNFSEFEFNVSPEIIIPPPTPQNQTTGNISLHVDLSGIQTRMTTAISLITITLCHLTGIPAAQMLGGLFLTVASLGAYDDTHERVDMLLALFGVLYLFFAGANFLNKGGY